MLRLACLVLGCVAFLGLGGCSRGSATPASPTARAARGRIERIVVATGTIEPEHEVEVRPRISGIVERVHVKAGDTVVEGQPLVEIDRELLETQANEARARLAGVEVELRYAERELERATALRRAGSLAEREYDQAREAHERGTAALARERATLESLNVQLRYATVRAPTAGTILEVPIEEGSAVASVISVTGGTLLLRLASTGPLHLEGLVDENDIAHVAVGQPVRIRTDAHRDRIFQGRVRKIAPVGERQQNVTYFKVEVLVIDDHADLLRPRMSGDADIVAEVAEDALTIPETALRYEGDALYVEVVRGAADAVERRQVALGIVENDRVQVLSGLAPDEEVRLR